MSSEIRNYLDEIDRRINYGDDEPGLARHDRRWLMGIVRQALAQGCQRPEWCPRFITESGAEGLCAVCELNMEAKKKLTEP